MHDHPYYATDTAQTFFAANRWPEKPAHFQATLTAYYRTMSVLAETVMRSFAVALDLDQDFFADKIDRPCNLIRLVRYPAQTEEPDEGQLRAGAHTDYGTVTILRGDDCPGQPPGKAARG